MAGMTKRSGLVVAGGKAVVGRQSKKPTTVLKANAKVDVKLVGRPRR